MLGMKIGEGTSICIRLISTEHAGSYNRCEEIRNPNVGILILS